MSQHPTTDRRPLTGRVALVTGVSRSIEHALSASRIVANCINPGPVDTGYADAAVHRMVASRFPDGRWGTPADIAEVVAFLVGDGGAWIRGQVLDVEGGFDRLR